MEKVVFNNPFFFKNTKKNIHKVFSRKVKETSGGKIFFNKCCNFLKNKLNAKKIIITNSCTSALEIAALLIDTRPGDEIIMPSYTFVSTANAFVLGKLLGVASFTMGAPDRANNVHVSRAMHGHGSK